MSSRASEQLQPGYEAARPGVRHRGGRRAQRRAAGWDPGRLPRWVPAGAPYLTVRQRFILSVAIGAAWAVLSTVIAVPWIMDLAAAITLPAAIAVIVGIAILPGYLNAQLLAALLFDRPRPLDFPGVSFPPATLLVAAYNEEDVIARTLERALAQDYPAQLRVVVIDDGSTDRTREIVREFAAETDRVELIEAAHGGKARALNAGLARTRTPLVATVDADTQLTPQALRRAIARLLISPPDTVAVAGDVMVRNVRQNLLTRMQDWDYVLGIASVKRQQGLVRGTLVAQGAFSVYETRAVKNAGGWPDMIGEDIVLTWSMLNEGGRVTFEPTAVAFTDVPHRLGHFVRQRRRWARGMIEGLREHGGELVGKRKLFSYAVGVNWGFPYLDTVFTFVWLPGLVLAMFGNFMIVGPMTLAVIPVNGLLAYAMYVRQRDALSQVGVRLRRNFGGWIAYFFAYQMIMAPVSVSGYFQELFRRHRRTW